MSVNNKRKAINNYEHSVPALSSVQIRHLIKPQSAVTLTFNDIDYSLVSPLLFKEWGGGGGITYLTI